MSCLELSMVQGFVWWYSGGRVRCSTILAKEFRKICGTASCLNISRTYKFANMFSWNAQLRYSFVFGLHVWRNPAMLKTKLFSKSFEIKMVNGGPSSLFNIGQEFFVRNFFCLLCTQVNICFWCHSECISTPGRLKSLPDHGGNRSRDLWDTISPIKRSIEFELVVFQN
jgi:hypothetical protein